MYKVVLEDKARKWLVELPELQKDSLRALIRLLREQGYKLTMPYSRTVVKGRLQIQELRCKEFGNRLYYFHYEDNIYICTNGGNKSKQSKDIKLSLKIAKRIIKE
jgi:hypothetical protein